MVYHQLQTQYIDIHHVTQPVWFLIVEDFKRLIHMPTIIFFQQQMVQMDRFQDPVDRDQECHYHIIIDFQKRIQIYLID